MFVVYDHNPMTMLAADAVLVSRRVWCAAAVSAVSG